jgi:hypothetical protein
MSETVTVPRVPETGPVAGLDVAYRWPDGMSGTPRERLAHFAAAGGVDPHAGRYVSFMAEPAQVTFSADPEPEPVEPAPAAEGPQPVRADRPVAFAAQDREPEPMVAGHSNLVVSHAHLAKHAEAIREGHVYGAREPFVEFATVATAATGAERTWAAGLIAGPVALRMFAGIPNTPLGGNSAEMPTLTLPAGAAGVNETTAHGEFDAVARAQLTAVRFGRWTDVTAMVDQFTQLAAISQAHAVGIARDLNLADGAAIQTAGGSPTAFDANAVDENVRAAILKVAAAALVDPSAVVLFGRSASLAVITGYAPTSGGDAGTVTTRVFGARVYTHEAATVKVVTAFAPSGFRTFAAGLRSASSVDPKTGGNLFGQWLHSTPAGVGIVGAAAAVAVIA